jgi:GT2 family glycosyltransferase
VTADAQPRNFEPVRVLEIDIEKPLPRLNAFDPSRGRRYRRALCLVRLHSQPLGIVELDFDANGSVSPQCLAGHVWQKLGKHVLEHLRQDGLADITELQASGLSSAGPAKCIEERERFRVNAPFVTVIVPTHDRPERIPMCLQSLLGLDYPNFEIVLVDNAPSTSATADLIQQNFRNVAQVRYVREDRPGLSWAHNCGRKVAAGKILAFTDDDVVVDRHWLTELVRGFDVADDVACVTGLVLPFELETPAQCWFEEFGGFGKGFAPRVYNMRHRPDTPLYPYAAGQFGTGANMAFTAAFLESIGGFDPALGPGTLAANGEDLSAFFQVIANGYTLVYRPSSLLYHIHRRDYPGLYNQIYTYGVGLTAFLTKCVLDDPRLLFDLLPRLPYGLFFATNSRSSKNRKKSAQYPSELTAVELKGMVYGPLAYLRSRAVARRTTQAT